MGDAAERLREHAESDWVELAGGSGRIFIAGHTRTDKHGRRVHVKSYFRSPKKYGDEDLIDAIATLARATSDDPAMRRQIRNQRAALVSELRHRKVFAVAKKLYETMPLVEKSVDLFVSSGPTPWPTLMPALIPMSEEQREEEQIIALARRVHVEGYTRDGHRVRPHFRDAAGHKPQGLRKGKPTKVPAATLNEGDWVGRRNRIQKIVIRGDRVVAKVSTIGGGATIQEWGLLEEVNVWENG